MPGKRPKIEPIRNPTLFEMDKLEQAGNLVNSLKELPAPRYLYFRYIYRTCPYAVPSQLDGILRGNFLVPSNKFIIYG